MNGDFVQIEYYVDATGKMPFWEWQKSLNDLKGKVAVLTRLNRVKIGNFGDWKIVRNGIYELRLKHGPGYRIYFGRESEKKIVILCGGDKNTQERDINKARKYWADYRGEK